MQPEFMMWQFLESLDAEKRKVFQIDPAAVVFKYIISDDRRTAMDYDNVDVKGIMAAMR